MQAVLANPELIDRELCERHLHTFIQHFWQYMDPAAFVDGWHVRAICAHLEAVIDGHIRNLLITMPPRQMKSLSISVAFPAWAWVKRPSIQFLFSSYAHNLSIRDSVKCRRLIASPEYQRWWGHRFSMVKDQNEKIRFDNIYGGYRIATSVGGMITGEGGDILVSDDPHNVLEVESDTVRESCISWWDESMTTRLNDQRTGARIIVAQRTHQGDLPGHVLELEGDKWVHLNLPAKFEVDNRCTTHFGNTTWTDPRKKEGELLWPAKFGEEEVSDLEKRLGPYAAAAQLQQRPSPRGGGMFKVEKFELVDLVPSNHISHSVRYWDKAGTKDGGKRSAGVLIHRMKPGSNLGYDFLVADVVKGQWSFGIREQRIKQTAELDGKTVAVWIEQEPGSGGKESAERTVANLAGFRVQADKVTGDKATRAEPYSAQVEIGNVAVLKREWTKDFLDEHELFPRGTFIDQVDAGAGAFNKLTAAKRRVGTW